MENIYGQVVGTAVIALTGSSVGLVFVGKLLGFPGCLIAAFVSTHIIGVAFGVTIALVVMGASL